MSFPYVGTDVIDEFMSWMRKFIHSSLDDMCDVFIGVDPLDVRRMFLAYQKVSRLRDDDEDEEDEEEMERVRSINCGAFRAMNAIATSLSHELETMRNSASGFDSSDYMAFIFLPLCLNLDAISENYVHGRGVLDTNHWVFICVNLVTKNIFIVDPLAHEDCIRVLPEFMSWFVSLDAFTRKIDILVPHDDNAVNYKIKINTQQHQTESLCGWYVMNYMEKCLLNDIMPDKLAGSMDRINDSSIIKYKKDLSKRFAKERGIKRRI